MLSPRRWRSPNSSAPSLSTLVATLFTVGYRSTTKTPNISETPNLQRQGPSSHHYSRFSTSIGVPSKGFLILPIHWLIYWKKIHPTNSKCLKGTGSNQNPHRQSMFPTGPWITTPRHYIQGRNRSVRIWPWLYVSTDPWGQRMETNRIMVTSHQPAQKNYRRPKHKCLGVVWALFTLRTYFKLETCTVHNDLHNLKWLIKITEKHYRLERWHIRLAELVVDNHRTDTLS